VLVSENFVKLFFVLLLVRKMLKRMDKSHILDFIAFYKMSQLWSDLGLYILKYI